MTTASTKKENFIESLKHQILVCDGAIGTELRKRIPANLPCIDACNVSDDHVDKVVEVHRAYATAGADVIQTNTYQANRESLAIHGLADRVEEINRAGVRLARSGAGRDLLCCWLGWADLISIYKSD